LFHFAGFSLLAVIEFAEKYRTDCFFASKNLYPPTGSAVHLKVYRCKPLANQSDINSIKNPASLTFADRQAQRWKF
jgi:hypothetical protein